MRFPDRLNHHRHHLTVGRQQSNIRRGISANPGKFHIENIETKHTYFLSEASFGIGFMILISLKMFFPYPMILEFPSIPILTSIFLLRASQPRHLQAAPGSNRTIIAALVELALTPVPLQYYLLIVWSSIHVQWSDPVLPFNLVLPFDFLIQDSLQILF